MNRTRGGRPTEFDDARLPVPVAGRPAADQMTDVVVMGIILIGIIGYGIDILMRMAEKALVPWKGRG